MNKTYCGYIKIIGKTNVGKSTLINKFLQKKISITSKKKHTTNQEIIGIKTHKKYQLIFVDTPGFEKKEKKFKFYIKKQINKIKIDANLIILVIDNLMWNYQDEIILNELNKLNKPVLLIINKIDIIKNKIDLLPYIEFIKKKKDFVGIIPISAKYKFKINLFKKIFKKYIPKSKHIFSQETTTTHKKKFIISEIIREKLIRFFGDELPYIIYVKIDKIEEKTNNLKIYSSIFVLKSSQKKIIIGKNGKKIKNISILSRKDIEKFFSKKIYLKLWVKIKNKRSKK